MKIGLFPYRNDLGHPADRRRFIWWARKRNHEIAVNQVNNVDFVFTNVLTPGNLDLPRKIPHVFEVIDGYTMKDSVSMDLGRVVAKSFANRNIPRSLSFKKQILQRCREANVVVCSSPEQALVISRINNKCIDILDNHSEFPDLRFDVKPSWPRKFFWEGQTNTIKSLIAAMQNFCLESPNHAHNLEVVTDLETYAFMDRFFPQSTEVYLGKKLSLIPFRITPWTVESVVLRSMDCNIAIIPNLMATAISRLKPENRLLIMLKLGLPFLASSTPSNLRMQHAFQTKFILDVEHYNRLINPDFCDFAWAKQLVSEGKEYLHETHSEKVLLERWDKVAMMAMDR